MQETLQKSQAHHLFCSHRRRRELFEVHRTHTRVSRKRRNVCPGLPQATASIKKIIQSLQVSLHCLSDSLNKLRIDREWTGFHSCPNHKVDTSHSVILIVRLPISCRLGNLPLQRLKSCRLEHPGTTQLRSDFDMVYHIGKSYIAQKKNELASMKDIQFHHLRHAFIHWNTGLPKTV